MRAWILLTLLMLWSVLALASSRAAGSTVAGKAPSAAAKPAASDTASSDGGFTVRVVEEGGSSKSASSSVRRALKRAEEHERRARLEARTKGLPQPPEPPDVPGKTDFDTSDNNVVRFGEDITIPEDKVVDGDVVAIGGSVTVLGRVKGDCVAIGGAVHVRGKGVVEGDAVSMGGGVTTSDSGSVAGSNVSLGSLPGTSSEHFWPMVGLFGAVGTGMWLITALIKLLLTLFFAWLALLLARERMVHAVDVMRHRFGRSFLWGLLGWAALLVAIPTGIVVLVLVGAIAAAILAITIIGIPVAILLLIALVLGIIGICVGAVVAVFIGFLNGAMFLGQRVLSRSSAVAAKPIRAILVGLALIFVLNFAGKLLQLVGLLVFHPFAIALGIAAGALASIVTAAGFGAMILTRFAPGPGAGGSQWWPGSPPQTPPPAAGTAGPPPAAGPTVPPPAAGTAGPPPSGGSSDAP